MEEPGLHSRCTEWASAEADAGVNSPDERVFVRPRADADITGKAEQTPGHCGDPQPDGCRLRFPKSRSGAHPGCRRALCGAGRFDGHQHRPNHPQRNRLHSPGTLASSQEIPSPASAA